MNKADSAQMASLLEGAGLLPVATPREASIVVLNTCVVRQSAEQRAIGMLDSLKSLKRARPGVALVLTGCMVGPAVEQLAARFPYVDLFIKPQAFTEFTSYLEQRNAGDGKAQNQAHLLPRPTPSPLVNIIQGCDNFCTYCIVPYRRGREKSRPMKEILEEVKGKVKLGMKEVALLGQNVNSYGRDLAEPLSLAALLNELNGVDGLKRIRFLTSHPQDTSSELIETMARLDKVCQHLNLPAQSGDDTILKAMGRSYTVGEYKALVYRLRSTIPGVAISTDIIVGFPGESTEQFENALSLLRDIRFDTVHVAAYSPRPGTAASRMFEDDVPPLEKRRRLREVEQLQAGIATEINKTLEGQVMEVLVEKRKGGKWEGRTRSHKIVFVEHDADLSNRLIEVRITRSSPWSLQGELVST